MAPRGAPAWLVALHQPSQPSQPPRGLMSWCAPCCCCCLDHVSLCMVDGGVVQKPMSFAAFSQSRKTRSRGGGVLAWALAANGKGAQAACHQQQIQARKGCWSLLETVQSQSHLQLRSPSRCRSCHQLPALYPSPSLSPSLRLARADPRGWCCWGHLHSCFFF